MRLCVAVLLLSACQVPLDGKTYLCDATRPCASGFICDCGTCTRCTGAGCTACDLNASAQVWWKLDSTQDDRALDCSGHALDGLASGPVSSATGAVGSAWVADGGRLIASGPALGAGSAASVSFWTAASGVDGVIYAELSLDGGARLQLSAVGSQFEAAALSPSFSPLRINGAGVDGGFQHVGLVLDSTRALTLWLDGRKVGAQQLPAFTLDSARWSLQRPLDEVRVFSRELTATEMQRLSQRACSGGP